MRPRTRWSQPSTNKDAWSALRENCAASRIWSSFSVRRFAGTDVARLVSFGSGIPGAKFICLADYANSRGAADMGLYPDLLPGYHSIAGNTEFHKEWARNSANRRP